MAQYDVYRNPNPESRHTEPYLVDIQNDLLSELPTRLIAPLATIGLKLKLPKNLCPKFLVEGREMALRPYDLAAISPKVLGRPVASLAAFSSQIIVALDVVTSGV